MQLGGVIKHYRKREKMRQYELAELLEVTQSYLSQIENNKRYPSIDLLKELADAFGLLVSHMIFIAEHNLEEHEISTVDNHYLEITQQIFRDANKEL